MLRTHKEVHQEICLLAIIYFVPVFSPDSRAYTCAQLAGSHILLAMRPVGFARFTGSAPIRPSHVAPHCMLCRPYVSHQARGLLAPRPCHATQHFASACATPPADLCSAAYLRGYAFLLLPLSAPPPPTMLPHMVVSHLRRVRKWTDELKNSKFGP